MIYRGSCLKSILKFLNLLFQICSERLLQIKEYNEKPRPDATKLYGRKNACTFRKYALSYSLARIYSISSGNWQYHITRQAI